MHTSHPPYRYIPRRRRRRSYQGQRGPCGVHERRCSQVEVSPRKFSLYTSLISGANVWSAADIIAHSVQVLLATV